ncbi:MAG: hypothetical protein AAGU78_10995 [Chloroflexota bacterium]|nr:hypothetical protein [Aggregatilineaceae bacterium]
MDDERDESRDVADESEAEPGDYSQHDADQGYAEDDAGAYTGEYTGEYAGEDAALDGDVIAPADEAEPAGEGFAEEAPIAAGAEAAPPGREAAGEPSPLDEAERLRQPRALAFRRRLRTQVAMLPLALALIALGVFLSARAFEVEGLPEIADTTLALGLGGALAFTAVFHSLIFGRRERGLLFFGLLPLVTAGVIYALVTFVEDEPDATEWWPVLLAALGITFLLTFALERGHDVRLILLGVLTLVAAGTAYTVTSGLIEQDLLDRAGEYWPLLLVALGIGLLPLAFRRTR